MNYNDHDEHILYLQYDKRNEPSLNIYPLAPLIINDSI